MSKKKQWELDLHISWWMSECMLTYLQLHIYAHAITTWFLKNDYLCSFPYSSSPLLSSPLLSCFNGGTFLNVVLRRMSVLHLYFWCFKFIYLKLKSLICNLSLLFWLFKKLDKEHYWRPLSSSLGASSGFREKLTASAGLGNIWGQSDFSTIHFCASVSLFFSSPPESPVYIHRQTQSAILWQ